MSLPVLMKALRQLSYSEMMKLSDELTKQLETQRSFHDKQNHLADILSKLEFPAVAAVIKQEDVLLRQSFSRKRSISVKFDKGGYYVVCETLPGSQVVATDLRSVFPQMLDQIVTMQALQNMK